MSTDNNESAQKSHSSLPELPLKELGSTGISVSCLGLGTVKFGRNQGVKYPSQFKIPDDMDVQLILQLAKELGINLIDTAPAYGNSEERLGTLLPDRKEWIICSKVGEEFENGNSQFDFTATHTRSSIERSLQRLRTDYLDLVLVHSDGNDTEIINNTDCFAELVRCREAGLIRAFGISSKTSEGGMLALEQADAVMVTCDPANAGDEKVIARATQLRKGVLIKKALDSGHALSSSGSGNDPVYERMEFIFQHPGISSVIIGSINPLHIHHNVQAAIAAHNAAHNSHKR